MNDLCGYRISVLNKLLPSCIVGFVFSSGLAAAELSPGPSTNDHLVPVIEYLGSAPLYRKLWKEKLFVTPGDVARYVQLPGAAGKEVAVSVYRQTKGKDDLPGDYWATVTQSSVPLWDCVPAAGVENPIDPKTVQIRRWDAPLPESTASAIHTLWLAMLSGTRPESEPDTIAVDSTTEIFFATDASGKVLEAQTPVSPKENTLALVKIGNLLVDYCSASAPERPRISREIDKEARLLLDRVSKH